MEKAELRWASVSRCLLLTDRIPHMSVAVLASCDKSPSPGYTFVPEGRTAPYRRMIQSEGKRHRATGYAKFN